MFGTVGKHGALYFFWFSTMTITAGLSSLLLSLCNFCLALLVLPFLCKLPILAPALLGRASFLLRLDRSDNSSATTVSVVKGVKLIGQELAGYGPILRSRAGGLGFHDYACRSVEELDCAAGFVLGNSREEENGSEYELNGGSTVDERKE